MELNATGLDVPLPINSGILNLHGWRETAITETKRTYRVEAEYEGLVNCPKCGSDDHPKFGIRNPEFQDLNVHAKRVTILVTRQRYRCAECSHVYVTPVPHMHEKHKMTERLVEYIREQSMRRNFSEIGREIGVDEGTVRTIFRAYAKKLDKTYKPYTPEWLGIDEVNLGGQARCVFTDISGRRVLDMLPEIKQPFVEQWLLINMNPKIVEVVTIDMHQAYRLATQKVLPKTKIIVDKFHVVRAANDALDIVRRATHKNVDDFQRRQLKRDRRIMLKRRDKLTKDQLDTLHKWIGQFDDLGTAYLLKEAFFDIYTFRTKYEAEMAYQVWLDKLNEQSDLIRQSFSAITTFMTNWREWIFNYFDVQATNAYTEGANGLIKRVQRDGRGYTFDVIRAKAIHGLAPISDEEVEPPYWW